MAPMRSIRGFMPRSRAIERIGAQYDPEDLAHDLLLIEKPSPPRRLQHKVSKRTTRKPAAGTPPPNRVTRPKPLKLKVDFVDLLMEERQGHRDSLH